MTGFSALYKKHAADVYHFALYLSGERAEAEDITSETFVRAWTSPEPIQAATVKGYLFAIARNLFLQGLRKKSRHVALTHQLRDPQASPCAQAEQKQELNAVLAGLQELQEIDRAALIMRAFDEMPYEEIARALGISLAAAKVKVHRARLALAGIRNAKHPVMDSEHGRKVI
jgi:RNA polymerase sigma-70 factor (ECF subfamily)